MLPSCWPRPALRRQTDAAAVCAADEMRPPFALKRRKSHSAVSLTSIVSASITAKGRMPEPLARRTVSRPAANSVIRISVPILELVPVEGQWGALLAILGRT